jgi:hypothetical protein
MCGDVTVCLSREWSFNCRGWSAMYHVFLRVCACEWGDTVCFFLSL